MNDTVKLIIEIDKRAYRACQELRTNNDDEIIGLCAVNAIADGTPLDSNSERAEVQAYFAGESYGWEQGRKALIEDVKAEIVENNSFAEWVAEEIFAPKWEYNKDAFAELACRKLARLGIVKRDGDKWVLIKGVRE